MGPGHYKLASGQHSQYIIDMKGIPPYVEDVIREMIVQTYNARTVDIVVGVPNGGTSFAEFIAPALSMNTQNPDGVRQVRMEKRGRSFFLPIVPKAGLRALVVDDVGTTYGSILEACKVLEEAGVEVAHRFVIINRNPNPRAAEAAGIEFLEHYPIPTYASASCRMCKRGIPLVDPNAA